jgi:hypothetical protein
VGDSPAVNYCEQLKAGHCTPQKLASIKHRMGHDKSVLVNYGQWAKRIFVGRDDVYLDGKLYDCPAPPSGSRSPPETRCGRTSRRSPRRP